MAAPGQHGGYRRPSSPAPASGPASQSRRTDGQPTQAPVDLPDAKYGENKELQQQQLGAPQAAAPRMPRPTPPSEQRREATREMQPGVGMGAPSQRPGEPVTAGSPMGPGPGPRGGGINAEPGSISAALQPYVTADQSGVISSLIWNLAERGM